MNKELEYIKEKHNMSVEEMDAYITAHKQIEYELGIDLITLFKISKAEHIYAYGHGHNGIAECKIINVDFRDTTALNGTCNIRYPIWSYGTSFALTREELEEKWQVKK